jgi:hypothetical protein
MFILPRILCDDKVVQQEGKRNSYEWTVKKAIRRWLRRNNIEYSFEYRENHKVEEFGEDRKQNSTLGPILMKRVTINKWVELTIPDEADALAFKLAWL